MAKAVFQLTLIWYSQIQKLQEILALSKAFCSFYKNFKCYQAKKKNYIPTVNESADIKVVWVGVQMAPFLPMNKAFSHTSSFATSFFSFSVLLSWICCLILCNLALNLSRCSTRAFTCWGEQVSDYHGRKYPCKEK